MTHRRALCPLAMLSLLSHPASVSAQERAPDFGPAAEVLERAVEERAFPGCAVAVGTSSGALWERGVGRLTYDPSSPKVTPETIYDLASLTKVVGTTTVVMALVQGGKLDVRDPVSRHMPEFLSGGHDPAERKRREEVRLEHLLTHSSGLVAWKPFYRSVGSYRALLREVLATPLEAAPGKKERYSDLNFILLGEIVARASSKTLAELEQELVVRPLGLRATLRNPPPSYLPSIAPTERLSGAPDAEAIHGVVHDENARAGEGRTGHAGLFSTSRDLAVLARELLSSRAGKGRLFSPKLVSRFTTRRGIVEGSSRALGWDTPSERSSAGTLLSRHSFGHTGFTGTSIWCDPQRDLYVILLSNRVHPSRQNPRIQQVRRDLADAVARAVDASRRRRRVRL